MKFELNAEKAKTQAKNLSAYLATINRKISLGNAFEAVAQLYGTKSWNVLSAQLNAEDTEPEVAATVEKKYFYVENGERVEAVATATMVSDDHRRDVTFSVASWLMTAKEEAILDLAEIDWYGDYAADAVSDASRDPAVVEVYKYLEVANDAKSDFVDDIGFCTTVNEEEAMRFLRAFRYPVFLKVALKLANCNAELYQVYSKHLDELNTQYFIECWAELERAWEEEPSVLDWDDSWMAAARGVTPCSGVVEGDVKEQKDVTVVTDSKVPGRSDRETGTVLVMKPGREPLSVKELRAITNDCQYYLKVAIEISLDDLIGFDMDDMNDYAEKEILSEGILSDLSYMPYRGPLGFTPSETSDTMYIVVTAGWEPIDSFDDDEEGEGSGD
jgi:hypothetical protein